jgi:hypothetical protein
MNLSNESSDPATPVRDPPRPTTFCLVNLAISSSASAAGRRIKTDPASGGSSQDHELTSTATSDRRGDSCTWYSTLLPMCGLSGRFRRMIDDHSVSKVLLPAGKFGVRRPSDGGRGTDRRDRVEGVDFPEVCENLGDEVIDGGSVCGRDRSDSTRRRPRTLRARFDEQRQALADYFGLERKAERLRDELGRLETKMRTALGRLARVTDVSAARLTGAPLSHGRAAVGREAPGAGTSPPTTDGRISTARLGGNAG